MTTEPSSIVTPARRPVAFLLATAITIFFGLAHVYGEFAQKSPEKRAFDKALEGMRIQMPGGSPTYSGIMERLNLTLGGLAVAIGMVNLLALRQAPSTLRQRAALVYCVAFACLGVLYRAHDLLIPGIMLGVAAVCYLTDAVLGPRGLG